MSNSNLKEHVMELFKSDTRLGGRKKLDYRDVKLERGISKTAEGSAKVTIGDTEVVVGVKVEIGTPYPDTPDQGTIIVGAELLPMSNPDFESGPPGIQAIELARVVDRGLRESGAIDFKELCIEEGEKVWLLLVDIIPINDDGNLFDAASLGALAAIKDLDFPKVEDDKVNYEEPTGKKINIDSDPLGVTVIKIGSEFIVDPDSEEEKIIDARLTVCSLKDGSLCALQKGGDVPLTSEEIAKMVDIGVDKAKMLREAL